MIHATKSSRTHATALHAFFYCPGYITLLLCRVDRGGIGAAAGEDSDSHIDPFYNLDASFCAYIDKVSNVHNIAIPDPHRHSDDIPNRFADRDWDRNGNDYRHGDTNAITPVQPYPHKYTFPTSTEYGHSYRHKYSTPTNSYRHASIHGNPHASTHGNPHATARAELNAQSYRGGAGITYNYHCSQHE